MLTIREHLLTTRQIESRRFLGAEIGNHIHLYEQIKWFLVDQARSLASQKAVSYRNFHVGCAIFAFRPDAYYYGDVHKVFRGANIKIEGNGSKICAEQAAISAARAEGYSLIIGMAVSGMNQPDENGVSHPTLHPCKDCRRLFSALPEVHPDTMIICANPTDDQIFEEFSVSELLSLHKCE